jgi:hypothetical protein
MTRPTTTTEVDALREVERTRAELGDFVNEDIALPDGSVVSVADLLDDLRADHATEMIIDALTDVALAGERH